MSCPTCNWCTNPGRCCTGFHLQKRYEEGSRALHPLEVYAWLASVKHSDASLGDTGVPFMPLWRKPDGTWRYWCPRLGHDGRCTDYENRPNLCRDYEAMSDALCALHTTPPQEPPCPSNSPPP